MSDFMITVLMTVAVAGATAPLVPPARTFGVNIYIWVCNRMKGKPTFRTGTRFKTLAAPSGVVYHDCYIESTDFGFVYVRIQSGGLLPIKKIRFKNYQAEMADDVEEIV